MKKLNGSELAGYIQERQAKQVRGLRQAHGIEPKLAIIKTIDDPVINTYVRLKREYGAEIGVGVEIHDVDQNDLGQTIQQLNSDDTVSAIIIQLPLADNSNVDEYLELVSPEKDVDGLGGNSPYIPATPQAIEWLLDGYNIDLGPNTRIGLVGRGRLVGEPLERLLLARGLEPVVFQKGDSLEELRQMDVVISATGVPGLIKADWLKTKCVAIDAGVATAGGKTVGDFDASVYERDDIILTPKKGGVGPLTVCALFENVIRTGLSQLG